jgi:hypothetical protein
MSLEFSIALWAEQDMTLQYAGIWKMPKAMSKGIAPVQMAGMLLT